MKYSLFLAALFGLLTTSAHGMTPSEEYRSLPTPARRLEFIVDYHNSNCRNSSIGQDAAFELVDMLLFEALQSGNLLDMNAFLKPAIAIEAKNERLMLSKSSRPLIRLTFPECIYLG
jgi:hypothetical protein